MGRRLKSIISIKVAIERGSRRNTVPLFWHPGTDINAKHRPCFEAPTVSLMLTSLHLCSSMSCLTAITISSLEELCLRLLLSFCGAHSYASARCHLGKTHHQADVLEIAFVDVLS